MPPRRPCPDVLHHQIRIWVPGDAAQSCPARPLPSLPSTLRSTSGTQKGGGDGWLGGASQRAFPWPSGHSSELSWHEGRGQGGYQIDPENDPRIFINLKSATKSTDRLERRSEWHSALCVVGHEETPGWSCREHSKSSAHGWLILGAPCILPTGIILTLRCQDDRLCYQLNNSCQKSSPE